MNEADRISEARRWLRYAREDLAELAEWAVEARYPGNWLDASARDAAAAIEQGDAVLQAVAVDLRNRGVSE